MLRERISGKEFADMAAQLSRVYAPLLSTAPERSQLGLRPAGHRAERQRTGGGTVAVIEDCQVERSRSGSARKQADGKTRREALRCHNRQLARRVWRLLQTPANRLEASPTAPVMIHCNVPYGSFTLT
jgi:hypothetical protein